MFNSFLASGDLCHLLSTFANSLDPDQDRHNVGPDLDSNGLTRKVFLNKFFEKVNFEKKKSADDKKSIQNYPAFKGLMTKKVILYLYVGNFFNI